MRTSLLYTRNTRPNSTFVLFTFALAFVVILLGAYTRLTNAGLSCPDWPHCYGFLTAPHTSTQIKDAIARYPSTQIDVTKAWTEMTHRYFAGTEGLLILFLAGTLYTRKARSFKSIIIASALILLLSFQVILGMLTVTEKLKPFIVLAHLLTGISILSVLWWSYLELFENKYFFNRSSQRVISWLWLGFFVVILQISLGGWVSTHYAGLACIDLPYCNGILFPHMQWNNLNSDLISIQMLHRIGAMITAIYLILLAFILFQYPSFRSISILLFALLFLQLTLGILNIIWLRPIWIAMLHQAIAIILLLTLITSLVKAYLESRDYRYAAWLA